MTREMKKKYAKDWIHINNEMLQEGGLGIQMIGDPITEFCAMIGCLAQGRKMTLTRSSLKQPSI